MYIDLNSKKILILFLLILILFLIYNIRFTNKKESFTNSELTTMTNLKDSKKSRIVVCFFGVIPRSIKYTWNSIKTNIIKPLQDEYLVDIYIFNLNVENNKIDGKPLDQSDVDIIPYDYKEEELQSNIEHEIQKLNKEYKFRYPNINTSLNCFRQMYSEYRVGKFLEKNINKYKGALVCGPDYNIYNSLNMNHFKDSLLTKNGIYGSNQNDALGYTNGFYFGQINLLCKILKRYKNIMEFDQGKDYEFLVKQQFIKFNISRKVTDIIFFKIRANKHIRWQLDKNYKQNNNTETVSKYIKNFKNKL